MPSRARKRNKGKERKVRKANETSASVATLQVAPSGRGEKEDGHEFASLLRNLVLEDRCACDHGRPSLGEDDVCSKYIHAYSSALQKDVFDVYSIGFAAKAAMEAGIEAIAGAEVQGKPAAVEGGLFNRETGKVEKGEMDGKVRSQLVALGADLLLKSCYNVNERELNMASAVAYSVCALEQDQFICRNGEKESLETVLTSDMLRKFTNLSQGGPRETIRFFVKRLPCSCLDDLRQKLKTVPTFGLCSHCHEWKERRELLLCTGCRYSQYCSTKCQAADWPKHRASCTERAMRVCLSEQQIVAKLAGEEKAESR